MRRGGSSCLCGASRSGISLPSIFKNSIVFLYNEVKEKEHHLSATSVSAIANNSTGNNTPKMLPAPKTTPADPRHRDIQNIIGHKANFFRNAILQRLVRIDSTYYRFQPAGIANQDYTVPLS